MSHASLTIVRYPKGNILFAILAMAVFHIPLWFNKKIHFYKLMGSGRNGTFDKKPDWQQWAILTVQELPGAALQKNKMNGTVLSQNFLDHDEILGSFIRKWFLFFKCETYQLLLETLESHGLWDGKKAFGEQPSKSSYQGPVAVLTRATIRLNKLKYFWENVAPVAALMGTAKGFRFSVGVGEIPWIKQATFSVWETKDDMKAFAYGLKEHAEVIKKTRKQQWYSEEMFTRFRILKTSGTLKGLNPLRDL